MKTKTLILQTPEGTLNIIKMFKCYSNHEFKVYKSNINEDYCILKKKDNTVAVSKDYRSNGLTFNHTLKAIFTDKDS